MKTTKKYLLPDQEIPKQWYNVLADLPPLQPMLHPATHEPVKPSDLEPLFAKGLIEQEFSTERWIPIPAEVRTLYKIYRPTPLVPAAWKKHWIHRQGSILKMKVFPPWVPTS